MFVGQKYNIAYNGNGEWRLTEKSVDRYIPKD